MKLLVTSPWFGQAMENLQATFPEVEFVIPDSPEAAAGLAADVEIIFGRPNRETFLAAKQARWIQSSSAGVEWMRDIPELRESDITITNTRGAHAATIAEHAMGMLVLLARGFPALLKNQAQKSWGAGEISMVGLSGLTMGIIGMGQIGRAVAQRAHAFEMTIVAVDAHDVSRPDYISQFWLLDGLPELMKQADIVVVAVPITPETRGMLGPEQLRLMESSAFLLVLSRGGIIDEPTLIEMLNEGALAGAGLDVAATEPLPADDPLWDAPNIFITPHCSPRSVQTRNMVIGIMRDNLRRYLAGEALHNLVDKKLGY